MFAQEQSDQSLQCLLESSPIRVHSVCSRAVRSDSTVFAQEQSDQSLQCLLKSSNHQFSVFGQEQLDQSLKCLIKSSCIRVYNI